MTITPDFITEAQERELLASIQLAMKDARPLRNGGRSKIIRFGWDYLSDKFLGTPPNWLIVPMFPKANSWTINEYPKGHRISPHIDSKKFEDDIYILSLGVDSVMRFTKDGSAQEFALPRRSLALMNGDLRQNWKHETLPTNEGVRYSIVYRKKV